MGQKLTVADDFADDFLAILNKIRELNQFAIEISKTNYDADFVKNEHSDQYYAESERKFSDKNLATIAKKLYQARRFRENNLSDQSLFHDPAWDILLDLFASCVNDQKVSIKGATLSGQASTTTALRYVWILEQSGLISRAPDPSDARRFFLGMTNEGMIFMRKTLVEYSKIGDL